MREKRTNGAGKKNIWCGVLRAAAKRTNGAGKRTLIDTCFLLAYNVIKRGGKDEAGTKVFRDTEEYRSKSE